MTTNSKQLINNNHESLKDYYQHLDRAHPPAQTEQLKDFIGWATNHKKETPSMIVAVVDALGFERFIQVSNDYDDVSDLRDKGWLATEKENSKFFFDNREVFDDWIDKRSTSDGVDNRLDWLSKEIRIFNPELKFSGDDIAGFLYADNRGTKGFGQFAYAITRIAVISVFLECRHFLKGE